MRLTKQQARTITQTVSRLAGTGTAVYLFGSRLNDQAKGGDIDLFIESDIPLSLIHRAQIKMELESQLGIEPKQADFSAEFMSIVKAKQADEAGMIK
ncbi:MAG: nucleotidyltransferase domain-containing protein [Methylobacter sp.]|nr:MAG: nucleotidyltransferase domain-containing protein [Methylobacter sp.]